MTWQDPLPATMTELSREFPQKISPADADQLAADLAGSPCRSYFAGWQQVESAFDSFLKDHHADPYLDHWARLRDPLAEICQRAGLKKAA